MKRIFALLLFVLAANAASAQQAAVRVNALALATGTLNAGIEVAVAERWSVVASGYWNPIATDNLRMKVLAGTVGVRRWRCEPYAGLFWGLHSTVVRYRVGNGRNRYNGWTAGAGSSVGYAWRLARRWSFSLEGGLGIYYMDDTRWPPVRRPSKTYSCGITAASCWLRPNWKCRFPMYSENRRETGGKSKTIRP